MKFIVHGGTLASSLNSIMGLVAKNNTIPIVENLLFVLNDKTLSITASDLETVANVSIELQEAEASGITKVCIPGKELYTLVSQLSSLPLTMVVKDEFSIEITTDNGGKYNFKGIDPDDYPQMIQIEDKNEFTIKSSTLVNGINKTLFAIATEDFRPQMTGVLCEFSPKGLTFVGTDSHKLVRLRNTSYATEDEKAFILPKKTLSLMSKILSSINEEFEVKVENNLSNIAFYFQNYHFACRLIEGKYPQYDSAIPNDNPNKLIVAKNSLLESVKRISIFTNPTTNQIRFEVNSKEIVIQAEDIDSQNKAQERIACSYEGEPMTIGLNAKFLTETISNVETENVCFEMSRPDRPCIVTPYDEETKESQKEETLLMLVMPVILIN
ncbi:MAG: DNA polymerase III subunit beta [Bacteroidales bacterium]